MLDGQDIRAAVEDQQGHSSAIGALKVFEHYARRPTVFARPDVCFLALADSQRELERCWWSRAGKFLNDLSGGSVRKINRVSLIARLVQVKKDILDTVQLPLLHPELFSSGLREL